MTAFKGEQSLPRGSLVLGIELTENLIDYHSQRKIILDSTTINPYGFTIWLDKGFITDLNTKAMLNSMDLLTWVFSICCLFGTYIFIFGVKDIGWNLPLLFSTMIDQGISLPKTTAWRTNCVFGIWMLMVIVITNGYSSVLSSLMTKSGLPEYPRSIQELANSSFKLASFSWSIKANSTRSYLVPTLTLSYYSEACKHCSDILNSIVYIPITPSYNEGVRRFGKSVLADGKVETHLGNVSWPPNFALIESTISLQRSLQTFLKEMLSSKKEFVMTGNADGFVRIGQHLYSNNYIYGLVRFPLRRLTESGLVIFWEKLRGMYNMYLAIEDILRLANTTKEGYPILGRVFSDNLEPAADDPAPLGLHFFRITFVILGSGTAISFFVLLLELMKSHYIIMYGIIIKLATLSWDSTIRIFFTNVFIFNKSN